MHHRPALPSPRGTLAASFALAALALPLAPACSTEGRGAPPPSSAPPATPSPAAASARAEDAALLVNRDARGVGLAGHDPVAYFEANAPVAGDPRWHATYLGTTYFFSSEARLWRFQEHPEQFAPAFGGFCAYAAAIDRLSPISPEFFQIVEGRLVLNHNAHAQELWRQDVPGNLAKAERNWPDLVRENGHARHVLVNTDADGLAVMGHDVIAYRTDGRAVPGLPEHESWYAGARYRFVSAEHRATFESHPAKYAPAYGGFCGYAVSEGRLRPIDPTLFQVEDDRLILQHSRSAYDLFNRDLAASVRKADAQWPGLAARSAL